MTDPGPSKIARLSTEQDAVRRQLDRILASSAFQASRQLGRFLGFVVEETLAGRGATLKQYTIATCALGRGEDFDPEADPVVRIEARRLRQTLEEYYAKDGNQDPILITVPKGHYAAAFTHNPDIKPQDSVEPVPIRPTAEKVVVPGVQGPTIVQLAFNNLSRDALLDDVALELTEEVASALSQFECIRLIGPFEFPAGSQGDQALQDIGRQHDADYVLKASLQGSATNLRVLPRLLDAGDCQSIWSESFGLSEDELADMGARECKLKRFVSTVADFYGVATTHWANRFLRDPKSIPAHQEAIALDRLAYTTGDPDVFVRATQACQRALERWPEDPIANALLAGSYLASYANDASVGAEALERAEACVRQAVAYEPALQVTRFTMAEVYFFKRDPKLCMAELEEAYRLNPYSVDTAAWIGTYYSFLGEWQRGMALLRGSLEMAPETPVLHLAVVLDHYRRGDYDGAWAEASRIHHSYQIWGHALRAASLGQLGRLEAARRELAQTQKICPDIHGQGRVLMRRVFYSDELVEQVIEGLDKAAGRT